MLQYASKDGPFSIIRDGSNNFNDKKLYPILNTYFDVIKDAASTDLLSLVECDDNTVEGIFNIISVNIEKNGLELDKCIGFNVEGKVNGCLSSQGS